MSDIQTEQNVTPKVVASMDEEMADDDYTGEAMVNCACNREIIHFRPLVHRLQYYHHFC
jgi:hypothetical protein